MPAVPPQTGCVKPPQYSTQLFSTWDQQESGAELTSGRGWDGRGWPRACHWQSLPVGATRPVGHCCLNPRENHLGAVRGPASGQQLGVSCAPQRNKNQGAAGGFTLNSTGNRREGSRGGCGYGRLGCARRGASGAGEVPRSSFPGSPGFQRTPIVMCN